MQNGLYATRDFGVGEVLGEYTGFVMPGHMVRVSLRPRPQRKSSSVFLTEEDICFLPCEPTLTDCPKVLGNTLGS